MNENNKLLLLIKQAKLAVDSGNPKLASAILLEAQSLSVEQPILLGDWIPEKKVVELLDVKKTTLWKLRKDGKIIATQTRPIFYSLNSIKEYLKSSVK